MSGEGLQKLQWLFLEAVELSEEQRENWIAEHCAADPELAHEIRALLKEDQRADDPLENGLTSQNIACMEDAETEVISQTARNLLQASGHPTFVGRYRVERLLGQGGFGLVYLAYDDQLERQVAIKVPHARLLARSEDADAYLAEARTVAGLDHPNIIPVYDVGQTDQFPCFAVAKYVEGSDLAQRLRTDQFSFGSAACFVATLAESIHFAHQRGIVHRDIKPANILIDESGQPHIGDFGLAIREQDIGNKSRLAGTPAYMSPEQARGDGHLVDGRSDVFSLGVVFYELLTRQRPFDGNTQEELLNQIATQDARPPRQINPGIPRELERICLKAISRQQADRYSSAQEFADDIRSYLRISTGDNANALRMEQQPFVQRIANWPDRYVLMFSGFVIAIFLTIGISVAFLLVERSPDAPLSQPVNESYARFDTPRNTVLTLFQAAENRDRKILNRCFADNAPGEFNPQSILDASDQSLEDMRLLFRGATILGVSQSVRPGGKGIAAVRVRLRGRYEELKLILGREGWKVVDF